MVIAAILTGIMVGLYFKDFDITNLLLVLTGVIAGVYFNDFDISNLYEAVKFSVLAAIEEFKAVRYMQQGGVEK